MHRVSRFQVFPVLLFLLLFFAADAYSQASCTGGNVDLKVCGAVGDDAADDSPALQAAFDALAAAGGGTLNVPVGRYRLASPVSKNFLNQGSLIIRGHGSATVFHFASGPDTTNIAVLGAESLLVEDLTFAGTPGVTTDAKVSFNVGSVEKTTFRRTDWYGVASAEPSGAVLWANLTDLLVENSSFRGCAASYWNSTPVVRVTNWFSTKFSDTDFIDYGTLHGVHHSKTPQGTLAWVYLTNPHTEKEGRALFSRMFLDEGATISIFTQTTPPAIIRFEHLGVNVDATDSGVGLKVHGAKHATVSHSYFGYASVNPRNAIEFADVGTAVVEQTELRDKANRILVDSLTKSLTISDSTVETLDADAEIITLKDSNIATLQLSPSSKVMTRSGGKLSAFALSLGGGSDLTTTSQTGSGSLVLANAPTLTGANLTGATLTGATLNSPVITNPNIMGLSLASANIGTATAASLSIGGGTPLTTTNRTGTGSLVLANSPTLTSPVFTTPNLGAATGSSLSLGGGTPLTTTNRTGTGNLVLSTSPTLTGATLTNPIINGASLSNATLGAAAGTSLALGGGTPLTTTNRTGTGNLVLADAPTLTDAKLTSPLISNATITGASLSGVTLTNPNLGTATGSSLSLGGGTPLTTTNRTGTGNLVMSNSPTLVAPTFVTPNLGAAQATSLAVGGGAPLTTSAQTGTGTLVLAASPTITSPTITSPLLSAPTISGRVTRTVVQLAPGAIDPSVADGDVFQVANPQPILVGNFRDGAEGQLIFLIFSDANTTVLDGPDIRLRGDFISKPDAVLILLRVGSTWFEISRTIDAKPYAAPKLDKTQPSAGKGR